MVDHVERLLELLDLVLVEHGEDVGGGSLGPLLGGAAAAGGLAGRHLGGGGVGVSGLPVGKLMAPLSLFASEI